MPPPEPNDHRLNTLEESLAFTDRQTEQLHEAVADLGQRVMTLTERMQRIEQRLGSITERLGDFEDRGVEPPPHSAGPDISRDPL